MAFLFSYPREEGANALLIYPFFCVLRPGEDTLTKNMPKNFNVSVGLAHKAGAGCAYRFDRRG